VTSKKTFRKAKDEKRKEKKRKEKKRKEKKRKEKKRKEKKKRKKKRKRKEKEEKEEKEVTSFQVIWEEREKWEKKLLFQDSFLEISTIKGVWKKDTLILFPFFALYLPALLPFS